MITGLDHLVLTVADAEATCRFYEAALGIPSITFAGGRRALQVGEQKINLHEVGREWDPKARAPTAGAGDFCLITDTPLSTLIARLGAAHVSVEEGPVPRTGARGPMRSVYFRDPDGNLVEVANYAEA
ncbi:VOC family protein [Chelatococcus reniformis]|uniref:Virulence protein n=1 Tax=Chelatococcus reniformis TaxID=1494448 RepID=A0A916XRF1_9HYPH|nr:VOC family protein [Chelatococcus reniformis]GGC92194.1 virulence protein [Chelatococcus reniformis]